MRISDVKTYILGTAWRNLTCWAAVIRYWN